MHWRREKWPSPDMESLGSQRTPWKKVIFQEGRRSSKDSNFILEVRFSSANPSRFSPNARKSQFVILSLILMIAFVPLAMSLFKDGFHMPPSLFSNSSLAQPVLIPFYKINRKDDISQALKSFQYLPLKSFFRTYQNLNKSYYNHTMCKGPHLKYFWKGSSVVDLKPVLLSRLQSRKKLTRKSDGMTVSHSNFKFRNLNYKESGNHVLSQLTIALIYVLKETDVSRQYLSVKRASLSQSNSKSTEAYYKWLLGCCLEADDDNNDNNDSNNRKGNRLNYLYGSKLTCILTKVRLLNNQSHQEKKNAVMPMTNRVLRNHYIYNHENENILPKRIQNYLLVPLQVNEFVRTSKALDGKERVKFGMPNGSDILKISGVSRSLRKKRSIPTLLDSPNKEIYLAGENGWDLKTLSNSEERIEWRKSWPSYEEQGLLDGKSEKQILERNFLLPDNDKKSHIPLYDGLWNWYSKNEKGRTEKEESILRERQENPWTLLSHLDSALVQEKQHNENGQVGSTKYLPTKKIYNWRYSKKEDRESLWDFSSHSRANAMMTDLDLYGDGRNIFPIWKNKKSPQGSFISKRSSAVISKKEKNPRLHLLREETSLKTLSPRLWNEDIDINNSTWVSRKAHRPSSRTKASKNKYLKDAKQQMNFRISRISKRKGNERTKVDKSWENVGRKSLYDGIRGNGSKDRGGRFLAITKYVETSDISQGTRHTSEQNLPSGRKFMVEKVGKRQKERTAAREMRKNEGGKGEDDEEKHHEEENGIFKGEGQHIASRSRGFPRNYQIKTRTARFKRKIDISSVSVLEGEEAPLPCDLRSPNPDDTVQIILWIKEGLHTPLYSYDFRELLRGQPKETKPDANSTLSRRTSFKTDRSPAALVIEKAELEDTGIYRCRVDFLLSPTVNHRVNLTVFVPPSRVRITWYSANSTQMRATGDVVGPFLVHSQPTLICTNDDGWPPPSLVWFEDGQILDDSYIVDPEHNLVENDLTFNPLSRDDLGRRLTCVASNTNRTRPAVMSVRIDLLLRIMGVRVETIGTLWANERATAICRIWGSRPSPHVVWWLGSLMLPPTETKTLEGNDNITVSSLDFIPEAEDDAAMLICQATNEMLPDFAVQDSTILNVNYAPIARVHLGRSLDPEKIKEGDDVYFECSVISKPPVISVIWKHNGVELEAGTGIIQSNMSLVVQGVTRGHGGSYTCHASNSRNTSASPPLHLDVKYTPMCASEQRQQHSVSKLENAEIACKVDANPSDVTFRWTFNNTAEAIDVPEGRFVVVGTESRVNYTPMNELDYGTLLCWANNSIGVQQYPCVFQIVAAGKPDPPHNCKVYDVTISSLQVSCLPGDDGGLYQTFLLQVYKVGSTSPVIEMERPTPSFSFTNLTPATSYKIVIAAINEKGASRLKELNAYTVKVPESLEETSAEPARDRERGSSIPLALLIGTIVAVVPIVIASIVFVWLRVCRNGIGSREENDGSSGSVGDGEGSGNEEITPSSHSKGCPTDSTEFVVSSQSFKQEDPNPDVILHTTDSSWSHQVIDIATISSPSYVMAEGAKRYPPVAMASTITTTDGGMPYTQIASQETFCVYPSSSSASTQQQLPVSARSQVPYTTDPTQQQQIQGNVLESSSNQNWYTANIIQEQTTIKESTQAGRHDLGCISLPQGFHLLPDHISKGHQNPLHRSLHRCLDDQSLGLKSFSRPVTICEITREGSTKAIAVSRGISRHTLPASIHFQSMGDISQCQKVSSKGDHGDPLTAPLSRSKKTKKDNTTPTFNSVESQSCQHLIKSLPCRQNRADKKESAV